MDEVKLPDEAPSLYGSLIKPDLEENKAALVGGKVASVAIDLIPVVGNFKGAYEAATGVDIITGEKLTPAQRAICVCTALPMSSIFTVAKVAGGLASGALIGKKAYDKVNEEDDFVYKPPPPRDSVAEDPSMTVASCAPQVEYPECFEYDPATKQLSEVAPPVSREAKPEAPHVLRDLKPSGAAPPVARDAKPASAPPLPPKSPRFCEEDSSSSSPPRPARSPRNQGRGLTSSTPLGSTRPLPSPKDAPARSSSSAPILPPKPSSSPAIQPAPPGLPKPTASPRQLPTPRDLSPRPLPGLANSSSPPVISLRSLPEPAVSPRSRQTRSSSVSTPLPTPVPTNPVPKLKICKTYD